MYLIESVCPSCIVKSTLRVKSLSFAIVSKSGDFAPHRIDTIPKSVIDRNQGTHFFYLLIQYCVKQLPSNAHDQNACTKQLSSAYMIFNRTLLTYEIITQLSAVVLFVSVQINNCLGSSCRPKLLSNRMTVDHKN